MLTRRNGCNLGDRLMRSLGAGSVSWLFFFLADLGIFLLSTHIP
ncbi:MULTISPECIES: hypothetical protein [Arthrospira]|nr:hypothetical protein [Arthrospira platensis]MDF2209446.1 hypothetical protein [Arthrospira platensis NCB002]MDT9183859.1 hypothetical protein [Limnospira sp. PMC 289.06]MDT9296118.1 hypothetical protein [Arthrospira platensis PCC 7345]MDT9311743.1 hypothetical protein [Limnospira sp. Paracas R14]WAK74472.1 hypothetical protein AP9108_34015 [Arthrospira sp. PCC 9108]